MFSVLNSLRVPATKNRWICYGVKRPIQRKGPVAHKLCIDIYSHHSRTPAMQIVYSALNFCKPKFFRFHIRFQTFLVGNESFLMSMLSILRSNGKSRRAWLYNFGGRCHLVQVYRGTHEKLVLAIVFSLSGNRVGRSGCQNPNPLERYCQWWDYNGRAPLQVFWRVLLCRTWIVMPVDEFCRLLGQAPFLGIR